LLPRDLPSRWRSSAGHRRDRNPGSRPQENRAFPQNHFTRYAGKVERYMIPKHW
jgi:hypothetical protein